MPPCAMDRPVGTELPNHLAVGVPAAPVAGKGDSPIFAGDHASRGARPQKSGQSPGEACRPLLLLGLVLLCLAPRALMAWKLGGVCPDGVAYIRLAELLDQGQGREFLRLAGVNPLPLVLVVLHRLGLDWEVAGSLWGVLMGAAVVLPLFGWLRRQFDRRVALAGCFLYAVHGELIRWSPEVLRDPTFWFLFTLGLYLLWRAVTEVRLGLFFSAAAAIVLASATRFEGLLLLVPAAGWSVARWRALEQGRARLAVGALACLGAVPAVAVAALLLLGIQGHGAAELLHLRPLILAGGWLQALAVAVVGRYVRLQSHAAEIVAADLLRPHVGNLRPHGGQGFDRALDGVVGGGRGLPAVDARVTVFMAAERPLPPGDRPGRAAGGDVGPSLGAALVVPALRVPRGPDGIGIGRPGPVARVGAGGGVLAVGRKNSIRHTPCAASPHTACAEYVGRGAGDRGRGRRAGGGVLLELQPAHGEGHAGPLAPRAARTVAGVVRSGRLHPSGQLLRGGGVFPSRQRPTRKRCGCCLPSAGPTWCCCHATRRWAATAWWSGSWKRRDCGHWIARRLPASCAGVSVWMLDRKTGTGAVAQGGAAPGETLPARCLSPFSAGGPSKKGTARVAGDRACKQTVAVVTEPVPIFDCRPGVEEVVDRVPRPQGP